MAKQQKPFYEFGPFRLEPDERQLLRNGEAVPLTPKAFDVLVALVQHSGHLMDKDELMKCVWPGSFVEEANLSHHVYKLREVLGAGPSGKSYIDTVPRRGYRFVAEVIEIRDDPSEEVVEVAHAKAHIIIEEDYHTEPDLPTSASPSAEPASPASQLVSAKSHSAQPLLTAPATKSKRTKIIIGAVALLLVLVAGVFVFRSGRFRNHAGAAVNEQIHSIAVLPFKPLAADQRDESLELGMADTLIMRLSSMQQVTVRPLSAVRQYLSLDQDAMEAGRRLQVEAVLEGSVQQTGDRVRVTARLLRLSDGAQLWYDKFDQKFTDVFALQDAIADRVATQMSQTLRGGQDFWAKRGTANTEAYLLYTRGRYAWSTFTPDQLSASITYFNSAIEKDPHYALAYAGLANAYSVGGIYGPFTVQEAYPRAKESALHALELDDSLADAYAALGAAKMLGDWDWEGAAVELRRAIELDPNSLDAHELYGYYFEAMGRADDAVAEMRRAVEIDPAWMLSNNDLIIALTYAGKYDDAIAQANRTCLLNPSQPSPEVFLGYAYLGQRRFDEATAAFQRAVKLTKSPQGGGAAGGLAYAYAISGRGAEAQQALPELERYADQDIRMPMNIAGVYGGLGDKDHALAVLEHAYQQHYPRFWHLKLDQRFDNLRSDRRFKDLLKRIGLPE